MIEPMIHLFHSAVDPKLLKDSLLVTRLVPFIPLIIVIIIIGIAITFDVKELDFGPELPTN